MYSGSYWRTAVILDDSSLQDVLLEENDQLVISFLEQHVMVYFFHLSPSALFHYRSCANSQDFRSEFLPRPVLAHWLGIGVCEVPGLEVFDRCEASARCFTVPLTCLAMPGTPNLTRLQLCAY